MTHPYTVRFSKRKTIAVEITRDASVLVRAPKGTPRAVIEDTVRRHADWIETHRTRRLRYLEAHPEPTDEEQEALIAAAKAYIPPRVAHYSALMGLEPAGITITGARTRFGSCSGKNRLCFSWRLMQYPPEAIDYVVVHELAHIRHKNHSRAFYDLVARYMPDHKTRRNLLKK
ncbi:MAG TPA: M48 family metallopeptidase [Papillibacter sp.]|jgi:predicted metal-dependent hydrolase|nr:M48 family metallopeptidase [Papillibacter sp.]